MNVLKLEYDERGTLALAGEIGVWKVLKKLLEADLARIEREMDERPKTCDEDWKQDQKWKQAQVAKLREILRLPEEAKLALEPEHAPEQSGGES